jgi:hypothetical protein
LINNGHYSMMLRTQGTEPADSFAIGCRAVRDQMRTSPFPSDALLGDATVKRWAKETGTNEQTHVKKSKKDLFASAHSRSQRSTQQPTGEGRTGIEALLALIALVE